MVYRLKYADVDSVLEALSGVLGAGDGAITRLASDERTGSIIVSARPKTLDRVGDLIETLDVPSERGATGELKVFQLVYADPESLAATISRMLETPQAKIAPDKRTGSLIVEGSPETLAVVGALVRELDREVRQAEGGPRPPIACQVRMVWLAAGLSEDEAVEPADDLKTVLGELGKVGVRNLRQVGQAVVHTMPDGEFQVHCLPQLGDSSVEWTISGELRQKQEPPDLHVRLSAVQLVQKEEPRGKFEPSLRNLAELETVIAAPYGHYVVLGSVPTMQMQSVFVVQVTPGKQYTVAEPESAKKQGKQSPQDKQDTTRR
jgi:hypothetical protein